MPTVRDTAVAGQFYPANPRDLRVTVDVLLAEAATPSGPAPKALIAPHAGYIYSGPVAASAYAQLQPHRHLYRRVVLLGPCHYVGFSGLALCSSDVFRTPLGEVAVDRAFTSGLDLNGLCVSDAAHRPEHSLEVHLPFLQAVLGDFALVPILVGHVQPEIVAKALQQLWNGPETLIVISSDLSHYLSYDEARSRDRTTCESIERLDPGSISVDDACGSSAVAGLLIEARRRHLDITTLDLRNSGDTAGPDEHVVGYGAWMLTEPAGDS